MRSILALAACLLVPARGAGQAPQSAGMWRVATASLATPAALQTGPTGAFWNPSTSLGTAALRTSVQVLQTPDAVGLSGILGGIAYAVNEVALLGLTVGRVAVRDLVRTVDSPLTELGSIPVYEQLVGVHGAVRFGAFRLGGMLRGHESRFDADRSTGATLDVGVAVDPLPRLTLAAATHFLPVTLGTHPTADYYAGVGYRAAALSLWGYEAELLGRYGLSYRDPGGFEHTIGAGVVVGGWLAIDGAVTREQAYGSSAVRPAFQLGLIVDRYAVSVARGSGINGLGATYRFAVDIDLVR